MFYNIQKIIFFPFQIILLMLVYLYKFLISPLLPKTCKFYPSCSTYTVCAIKEFGAIAGLYLGIKRIIKCSPFSKGGEDYVPINIKGDKKWTF